jgi:hypothetical protein
MYKNILIDFLKGLTNSARFDYFLKPISENLKLRRLVIKICKYNFFLHFLPSIILYFVGWLFNTNMMPIMNVIVYPINIFSSLFHLLHYFDLVNMVCFYSIKTSKSAPVLDMLSLTITLTIYQLVIYLTTTLVNLMFHDRLYLLALCLNFVILTIYHSFYCFNNLWQYKKIDMFYRIDMHEKIWPYYIGYGVISTIIYLHIDNPYMLSFYNLYMALLISLPFLLEVKYPKKIMDYPSINLTIFSYIIGFVFVISKYILSIFKVSSN